MHFSKQLTFSEDQAITADAVSTNTIDFGATGTAPNDTAAAAHAHGKGTPLPLLIQVTEDFNTLTSLEISVQGSNVSDFSSGVVTYSTQTILLADLVAGKKKDDHFIPAGFANRYCRLNYNVNGTNPTTGKITAGIVAAVQND